MNQIDINNLQNWAKNESKEMDLAVKDILDDLNFIALQNDTNKTKEYLEKRAKNLYLNINDEYDRETLKNDLFNDYVLRVMLDIKNDKEYFQKMKEYLNNF